MLEPSIVKDEEVEYLIKDVHEMYGYDYFRIQPGLL
ncbi:hypothetical protein QF044_001057 [Chryseobacterium sp. W4I1]|nr:hypothetical protein [Chryseobacterium sp. W4I1]